MSKFAAIRKYKNPKVKRNRLCLYRGRLMRISSTTDTGGLKLRREIICHPNDDNLMIEASDDYMTALEFLDNGAEMVISNGEDIWNGFEDKHKVISDLIRRMVFQLIYDAKMLSKAEGAEDED